MPAEAPRKQRTFVALWPDPELQQRLHNLAKRCAKESGGRAIRAENIHLTLAFLGDLLPARVQALLGILRERPFAPIDISLDRIGYWRRPRIVWIGSDHPPPALLEWQADLVDRLRRFGFALETRPFEPHVTLLRKARRHPRLEAEPMVWQAGRVSAVISVPTPAGVVYRLLEDDSAEDGGQLG